MGAVEFLAVILVWLQVVSAVVCRGREHSAKRVEVRYLSYNAKFVYNSAVVAIVKPVFHDFKSVFYGGKCTKLFLIEVFFASILKNKSGKTKELILRFSALLLILQGYTLWALQKTVNALEERANVSSQIKVTFQIVFCRSNFLGMKKNSSIASPYSSL